MLYRFLLPYLFVTLAIFPAYAHAESTKIASGEYITEAGSGTLNIDKADHFIIEVVGANAHTCNLEGEIKNAQAVLEANDPKKPCVVKFSPKGADVEVSSVDSEICRYFCGMRAYFEGLYVKPPVGCSRKDMGNTRKRFQQLYAKKAFDKAAATLKPLLRDCGKILDWIEFGQVRNDLAITQYHLGELENCQKTLAPIRTSVGKTGEKLPDTEQALKDMLPPADFESYLPIAKATWHNWALCTQQK